MQMIDNDLEQFYGDIKEMCNTAGYKAFCTELETQIDNINSVEYTKNADDLNFRKGQLNIIRTFLNLELSIKAASEQLFVGDTNA
jgi:hypothetical protein